MADTEYRKTDGGWSLKPFTRAAKVVMVLMVPWLMFTGHMDMALLFSVWFCYMELTRIRECLSRD